MAVGPVIRPSPLARLFERVVSLNCHPSLHPTTRRARFPRDLGGFFLPRNSTIKRLETPYFSVFARILHRFRAPSDPSISNIPVPA